MSEEKSVLSKAFNRAIGGGITGASAMIVQVSSLMWLRTTMNYQYRYGGTMGNAFTTLYKDGGIRRFYRGYGAAIAMGPLARFGDTAANAYVLSLLEDKELPTTVKTLAGSAAASSWRAFLMPLDALKTTLQVEGQKGISLLGNKMKKSGPRVLYHGTGAAISATFVGHYPWFLTYNLLNERLPKYDETYKNFLRNGFIGFNAAVISDCCSNSIRVLKTAKQTNANSVGYLDTAKGIIEKEGVLGLMGRGLKTRILTNGIQGMMFTVCWKYFEKIYFSK